MSNVFKEVFKFNNNRRLIDKGYNESKEASFITEELTELLRTNDIEQKVDGYADIIVFAIGSILKLGYNPEVVMDEVTRMINSEIDGFFNEEAQKYIKGTRVYKADLSKAKL